MSLASPYPKRHIQAALSPNPTAITADGQIRRMTGSGAGAKRESASGSGAAETDADGGGMVIPSLIVRHGEDPR
jgi:hypothetical protein